MKRLISLLLSALALGLPACTEVHEHETRPTVTATTQSHSVHTPVGSATTSTTTRNY